jgi:hypothetical protein
MKNKIAWLSTGVLSLLLAGSAGVFAQDKPDEDKPPRQEEPKKDDAKPPKDEAKPAKQDDVKPEKRDAPESRDQDKMNQDRVNEDRAKQDRVNQDRVNDDHSQGMDHAQTAGKSTRIPDDRFRANFGRSHTVVINRPVIVDGQPRFQSGGYWFIISDPWPVGWAYTDQCYIDYIDGEYFLFDVVHPGVRIALVVTL